MNIPEMVYVLSAEGKPLMPTKRKRHTERLLNKGKARIVSHEPFIIRLKYETTNFTQPLHGGTDPGRTNIGNAVTDDNGHAVYKDHVSTRNKDVPKLMKERSEHRSASRRGERLRRKRRAQKNGTTKDFPNGRMLPGYEKPVMLKDIINTEARFLNRKKDRLLSPTANQLKETHLNQIRKITSFLPVTSWSLEINKFAFMLMEDGSVKSIDFQNGTLKGFKDINDYIFNLQKGRCACCGKSIEHYHHIIPKHEGGADTQENIVGLCLKCHEDVHTGKISLNEIGKKKRYAALSNLNQAIPYILDGLKDMFGEENVYVCGGYDTSAMRELYGIGKDHPKDAVCIASHGLDIDEVIDNVKTHEVQQFRRHDRQKIKRQTERTYYLNGKAVAKNRKPRFEQKGPALSDLKLTEQEISKLTVKKSRRYYNNPDRKFTPGDSVVYRGGEFAVTGQLSGGKYLRLYGQGEKNFPARECILRKKNTGLVYVG